jgi:hypothetical protein
MLQFVHSLLIHELWQYESERSLQFYVSIDVPLLIEWDEVTGMDTNIINYYGVTE